MAAGVEGEADAEYIIGPMRGRWPGWPGFLLTLALVSLAACSQAGLGKQYEYEEELYLDTDGSATLVVNASLPALVALRGLRVPIDPAARFDRGSLRALYETDGVSVQRVSRPWRRKGRRFVQVRLDVAHVSKLSASAPFAWSTYDLSARNGLMTYVQTVGAPPPGAAAYDGWQGDELVAFRLHLPSRIQYHNAPSKQVERGNILAWEQRLQARLAGEPLRIEVRMDRESILYRTVTLFALAFGAAMILLAAIVWWVVRKGRASAI